jgi:ribosomal-protein-alanine N-acetyltransferase
LIGADNLELQVALREIGDCVIRRCDPSDLIPVMEINMKTLPEHYSDYFYESLLAELPESFLVAEVNRRLVGYIMCKTEYGFSNFKKLGFVKKGHVVSVAVLEEQRKKGIGRALIEEAIAGTKIKKADELYLEVRCSNNEAVKLYEKIGFIIKQRIKSYYRDGEDAYLMAIEFFY